VRHQLRQQLGKFLRERRGNLTLAQFARKTGISDSTLQRLEIFQPNVTLDTLELILKKLNCDLGDIFNNRG